MKKQEFEDLKKKYPEIYEFAKQVMQETYNDLARQEEDLFINELLHGSAIEKPPLNADTMLRWLKEIPLEPIAKDPFVKFEIKIRHPDHIWVNGDTIC